MAKMMFRWMPRRALLSDNADIGDDAFGRMVSLRAKIRMLVEDRETFVVQHGLDRAFSLPDGNWTDAANDFQCAYRYIRDGDYDVLNRLRLWSQNFTGYQLLTLRRSEGLSSINPIPADYDAWLSKFQPCPDLWARSWRQAVLGVPKTYRFSPPWMLGEVGWNVDGTVVNHDTFVYQERMSLLYESGVFRWLKQLGRPPRVLEIGAGYGALANALIDIFPGADYVICDLPESLMFSGLYLTAIGRDPAVGTDLSDPKGLVLLPNYLFPSLIGSSGFDLVINTLSMAEMTEYQIRIYASGIARLITDGGVFFEQNQNNAHLGLPDLRALLPCFLPYRRTIRSYGPSTQGVPTIWANRNLGSLVSPAAARARCIARWSLHVGARVCELLAGRVYRHP